MKTKNISERLVNGMRSLNSEIYKLLLQSQKLKKSHTTKLKNILHLAF